MMLALIQTGVEGEPYDLSPCHALNLARKAYSCWYCFPVGKCVSDTHHRSSVSDHSYRLSTLLICRFLLDIRHLNAHPNGISTTHNSLPITSFHAAARHAGDAVVEEFGDPLFNSCFTDSQSRTEALELSDLQPQPQPSEPTVDLTELPQATGESGDIEQAPVSD
jgi:hypothetical protein